LVAEHAGMLRELKYGILGKKEARLGFNVHCRSLKVYDKFWASLWKTKLEDGEERKPPVVMFESAKFPSGGRGRRMVGVKKSAMTCVRMHHTFPVAHWHTTASCTCGHVLEDVTYVAPPATKDEKRVKKLRKRKKRLEKSVKKLGEKNTTKSKGKKVKRELESATERLTRAEKKVEEDAQSKEEKTRTSRDLKVCNGTCRVNGTSLKNRDVHAAYENIGFRGVIKWVFGLPCPGRFHPNQVIRGESQVSIPAFDELDIMKRTIEKVECCAMAVEAGEATGLVQAWELEAEADAAFELLKDDVNALRATHYAVVQEAYKTEGMSTKEERTKVYTEAGKAAEVHMPNVRLQASRISECLDGVRGILRHILEKNPNLSRPFPARRAAGDAEKTATCMQALLSVEEEAVRKAYGSQYEHPRIIEAKGILANAEDNHRTAIAAAEWAEECRGHVKRRFEERYWERVLASPTGAPTRVTRSFLAAQQVARTNARTNARTKELTQIEGDKDWKTLCMKTKCADEAAKNTRAKLQEFATLLGRCKGPPKTSEKKSKRRYRTGLNMFRWNGASSLVGDEGAADQDVRGPSGPPAAGPPAASRPRRSKRLATSQGLPDKDGGRSIKAPRSTGRSEQSGASNSKRRGASTSGGTRAKQPRKQRTPVQAREW